MTNVTKIASNIVLSGGGTRCISFVGALFELKKLGLLQTVRKWYATSGGCLIAVLFTLTDDDKVIYKMSFEMDFTRASDISIDNLLSMPERLGIDPGILLRKTIALMLESVHKGSSSWTLSDHKKHTGHTIHFFISNVTTSDPFFASSMSHPDLFLLDALYATMAIPIYFQPYKHLPTGHLWCDGMLGGNFPWNYIDNTIKEKSIGLFFPRNNKQAHPSFFLYLNFLIGFRNNYEQDEIIRKWGKNCIRIPTSHYPSIQLDLTQEDREYLYNAGKEQVVHWYSSIGAETFRPAFLPENQACPPQFSGHRIRSQSQSDQLVQLSETQQSLQYPYKDSHPSLDLSSESQRFFRRWSV